MSFDNRTYQDDTFEKVDITESIDSKEFEYCTFKNCNLSNIAITSCKFIECNFTGCDISMSKLTESQFSNVEFRDCKILGVKFNFCNKFLFDVRFYNCILDYSTFPEMKIPKTPFLKCSLKGVDFAGAMLEQAKFNESDLTDTIFESTNLKGADFSSAHNYIIDPRSNLLKNAKFSRDGLSGLLTNLGIKIVD
ncbi:pentapeptide repeat-containing protein [Dysgonomonas sp. 520]|nr:pentapeptide repeat-containing protein [Dysgonomonas sp. 520]